MTLPPVDASWYQRPAHLPTATSAGGIVVRRAADGTLWIALIHDGDLPLPVLPKGHLEAGETPEQAARREIAEEAGFTQLTLLAELGSRARLSYNKSAWKTIHYFLYATTQVNPIPTDPAMTQPPLWVPLDDLPPMFWPEQHQLVEGNRAMIQQLMAQG